MPKRASHARSSASTTPPRSTPEVPVKNTVKSTEQAAVSAVAESSASTQPQPEVSKPETASPNPVAPVAASPAPVATPAPTPVTAGEEVKEKADIAAPPADPAAKAKKKRPPPGPFNPAATLKRAATLLGQVPAEPDATLQADADEVSACATSLNAAKGKLGDAVANQATAEQEAAQSAAELELATAMVVTFVRLKVGGGKLLVRHAKKGDAFTVSSALLGQVAQMKAQVPAPLVADLTRAHHAAAPAIKVRTSARASVKQAQSAYKRCKGGLTLAMDKLKASLAIHKARAKRLELGPPEVVAAKKGAKRTA